jgi:hypothetical protein
MSPLTEQLRALCDAADIRAGSNMDLIQKRDAAQIELPNFLVGNARAILAMLDAGVKMAAALTLPPPPKMQRACDTWSVDPHVIRAFKAEAKAALAGYKAACNGRAQLTEK